MEILIQQRKRESTETRQRQIVETALCFFGEKGISGTTTAEIASTEGISEGNIYRHYRNKEAILVAVIDKIGCDLSSILAEAAHIANPIARLEEVFKRHLAYLKSHRDIARTIFFEEVMVSSPELRKKVRRIILAYYKGIRKTFGEGQEAGLINRLPMVW